MATSKLQRYVSEQLSIFFGGYTIRENYRPDWLNTSNGGYLELDFFIEELNLAIEVQGSQHYEFIEFFHNNHTGYKNQLKRDRAKKSICFNVGVKLFEISSTNDVAELIDKIKNIIHPDMVIYTEQEFCKHIIEEATELRKQIRYLNKKNAPKHIVNTFIKNTNYVEIRIMAKKIKAKSF